MQSPPAQLSQSAIAPFQIPALAVLTRPPAAVTQSVAILATPITGQPGSIPGEMSGEMSDEVPSGVSGISGGVSGGVIAGEMENPISASVFEITATPFKDFYATHRDKLARALGLYFGNEDLGAEAADEAFTRAFERWQSVSQHPNPYGWVYVVGTNRARSVLRRRVLARDKRQLLEEGSTPVYATNDATGEAVDLDTKAAVARLRPALRSVVIARFYLEMSVQEAADVLNVKPGTIKSRLSRALDQLRSELGQNGPLSQDKATQ